APYRVQSQRALQALAERYGVAALRLWVLALANPGVLYATNPATLSAFFDELAQEWQSSARLTKDWVTTPMSFSPAVHSIARRISSRGSRERLERISSSKTPIPLSDFGPGVEAYICWTGGYLQTFLDRLPIHLPSERYRLIPMYSMSTESIETVSHFEHDRICFLPMARKVVYEFIEEGLPDHAQNLMPGSELQIGKCYAMVISNPYGLQRYQTGDVFYCRGFVGGLPDLHFLRRRDLEYSFCGEKLTAHQLSAAFQKLHQDHHELGTAFLTCIPSHPLDEAIPHYNVVAVNGNLRSELAEELGRRCDELLCEANSEYKHKRESGRLDQTRIIAVSAKEFVKRLQGASLENQFKFQPLYRRRWEERYEA
ncbi:MAG TPA: GH3 auxin-responsive promoter family protein, partial [Pyrinomonadaceae bacterium]|nr:GH3 auxin-responsive promoter family protein [Pyrinomonadaceae bacterium]